MKQVQVIKFERITRDCYDLTFADLKERMAERPDEVVRRVWETLVSNADKNGYITEETDGGMEEDELYDTLADDQIADAIGDAEKEIEVESKEQEEVKKTLPKHCSVKEHEEMCRVFKHPSQFKRGAECSVWSKGNGKGGVSVKFLYPDYWFYTTNEKGERNPQE
jgi:hypothetical protein